MFELMAATVLPGLNRFRDQAINHVVDQMVWTLQCHACYKEWPFPRKEKGHSKR